MQTLHMHGLACFLLNHRGNRGVHRSEKSFFQDDFYAFPGGADDKIVTRTDIGLVEFLLQIGDSGNLVDKALDLRQVDPWRDPVQRGVCIRVFCSAQKIKVVDFSSP